MTDESYLDDQQRKLAESEVSSAGDDVELVVKAESGSALTTAARSSRLPAILEQKPSCRQRYCHKGNLSTLFTAVIMGIGIALVLNLDSPVFKYILAFGIFGFAGGVTNWVAVKMLFDRIPFLIGSGVVPRRFKEIRETVKNTIMATFFDPEFLENYMRNRLHKFLLWESAKEQGEAKDDGSVEDSSEEKKSEATPQSTTLQMSETEQKPSGVAASTDKPSASPSSPGAQDPEVKRQEEATAAPSQAPSTPTSTGPVAKLSSALESEDVKQLIKSKLEETMRSPTQTGQVLAMASMAVGGVDAMVDHLRPLIAEFGRALLHLLGEKFDPLEFISIEKVREEIDALMTEKMEELTAKRVKQLIEDVIRSHLGWLIVWGNVFGGLLGLISQAVGYGI